MDSKTSARARQLINETRVLTLQRGEKSRHAAKGFQGGRQLFTFLPDEDLFGDTEQLKRLCDNKEWG